MNREQAAGAVTELFDRMYSSLVRYAHHCCGSAALAEEFTQEAFASLYRSLREGAEINSPRAWLLQTIRNQVSNHWRSQRRGEVLLPNSDLEALADAAPDELETNREPFSLAEYLSVLTRREEEAVLLRVNGLRYRQIAAEMGISTGSVGVLILRAVRKIRAAREKRISTDRLVKVYG